MNSIVLSGRLGRDPKTQYFESGAVKYMCSLAVDGNRKDADPDWWDLVMWGKTAEVAANYLKTGSQIEIEGRLCQDTWTDKQTGEPRSKDYVTVNSMRMVGSKKEENAES